MKQLDITIVPLAKTMVIVDADGKMLMAALPQAVIDAFEYKERSTTSLEWMTTQLKWQYDNEKDALGDEGSQGGYSPELQEAMDLLKELKK